MLHPHSVLPAASRVRAVLLAAGLAAAAWVGVGTASVRAADLETFAYGRWSGSASTDDSGSFSRCSVNARFRRASPTSGRDIATTLGMDRENGWTLGLIGIVGAGDSKADPYRLTLDGAPFLEVAPEAVSGDVALLPLAEPARLLALLKTGGTLSVTARDDAYDLSLAGIGRAIDWVEDCARRYESFVPAGREKEAAEAAQLRQDVAAVMRRLFETVSAKGIRVGPPAGVPDIASEAKSVPWRGEGVQGEGQVWAGRNADALANRIIKTSQGCKRRAAAGAKAKKNGKVVLAVVDCSDPLGARRVALVLVPRDKGGIYLISVHSRDGEHSEVDQLGERLADAARKSSLR